MKRRSADSIGSPSLTSILMETGSAVEERVVSGDGENAVAAATSRARRMDRIMVIKLTRLLDFVPWVQWVQRKRYFEEVCGY